MAAHDDCVGVGKVTSFEVVQGLNQRVATGKHRNPSVTSPLLGGPRDARRRLSLEPFIKQR
jgi:hypothetical protein